jgi:hypothetical protein
MVTHAVGRTLDYNDYNLCDECAKAQLSCGKSLRVTVRSPARGVDAGERLVHDSPNGTSAPAALRAAAETAVHFTASPRRVVAGQRRADVVVGQHVTGADDHRGKVPVALIQLFYLEPAKTDFQSKKPSFDIF